MPPTLESKERGINFHDLSSLAHKRFTQTIFSALSNNVKTNFFLFLIIVFFLEFWIFVLPHVIEYYVIYLSVNPFGVSNTLQIKVSLDIANVLTIFTLP